MVDHKGLGLFDRAERPIFQFDINSSQTGEKYACQNDRGNDQPDTQ